MEHKNITLEVLKKLLNDEIRTRTKKNLIQSKSLMKMLEASIKKNHNKTLTAVEVIEELIKLSKEIRTWVLEHNIKILNVAGSRVLKDPNIYRDTGYIIEGSQMSSAKNSFPLN